MQQNFYVPQEFPSPTSPPHPTTNGAAAPTVIPAQAGIQTPDSTADLPERTPYQGRPSGRRLLPDAAAQEIVDKYFYDGISQACLGRLLAEWGYPMGLSSLRNMLAGRTYPHLRRPARPAAAGDQP